MTRRYVVLCILSVGLLAESMRAQSPGKIDFGRDVLPILRQHCIGCHGASQQMNGLRLDRRSSVFRAGARRVVPGSSDNSFLYHRLIGSEFGLQMPPTGALAADQIQIVKTWIDEGAVWPDSLANEANTAPLNATAVAMVAALRTGDQKAFMRFVTEDPQRLNARGPEGSTPFMYAVLYSDTSTLEQLLKKGADPKLRNDDRATALMWAATDLSKTRLLLDHGADVNAVSNDSRTALMIAAARPGGAAVVKLLLDRGADPNPKTLTPPILEAATAGDADSMELLLARGASVVPPPVAGGALVLSARAKCSRCIDLLVGKNLPTQAYTGALPFIAALGDAKLVALLLEHGADVNAVHPLGRTALMFAAISDFPSLDVVRLLVERGANVNATSEHKQAADTGRNALDMAKFRGNTDIVELLARSGAKSSDTPVPSLKPRAAASVEAAVQRSLPLLQRTDSNFVAKAGCVSCHNDSLAAMVVGLARARGIRVDETIASEQVKANALYLEQKRDLLHQGFFFGAAQGDPALASYILIGLDAEHHKPDLDTDAVAMFVKDRQMPDGRWAFGTDGRPPLCSDGDFGSTVLALRALQLYAPVVDKPAYEKSVQRASRWLAQTPPMTEDDRSWRLLGLAWARTSKDVVQTAVRDLLAAQRSDGGWSDLASRQSHAYATGKALVALHAASVPTSNSAYQRGVQFLMTTQMEDGSWYVRTRAGGIQPYFDNGFPYGVDQWVSAAGTSWAAMALTLARQPSAAVASSARAR